MVWISGQVEWLYPLQGHLGRFYPQGLSIFPPEIRILPGSRLPCGWLAVPTEMPAAERRTGSPSEKSTRTRIFFPSVISPLHCEKKLINGGWRPGSNTCGFPGAGASLAFSPALLRSKSRLATGREQLPVQKDLSPRWASGQGDRPPALFSFCHLAP